ncbi:hypothetical protein [Thermomicrobium sp.]
MTRAIGEDEVAVLDEWSLENAFLPPCDIEGIEVEREEDGYGRAELGGCHRADGARDVVPDDEQLAEISQYSGAAGSRRPSMFGKTGAKGWQICRRICSREPATR